MGINLQNPSAGGGGTGPTGPTGAGGATGATGATGPTGASTSLPITTHFVPNFSASTKVTGFTKKYTYTSSKTTGGMAGAAKSSSGAPVYTVQSASKLEVMAFAVATLSAGSASFSLELRYGTGTPPAYAASAASAGSAVAQGPVLIRVPAATGKVLFVMTGLITVTPSSTYWLDIAQKPPSGDGTKITVGATLFRVMETH